MGQLEREIGKRQPFASAAQEALLSLMRTADQVEIRFGRMFREFGLTGSQYNVLRILRGEGGPLPILEIAARTITVVPGMTGIIDRMELAGLVTRERCKTDRRVVFAAITPTGTALLDRIDAPLAELHEGLVAGVSQSDLAILTKILERLRAGFEPVPE